MGKDSLDTLANVYYGKEPLDVEDLITEPKVIMSCKTLASLTSSVYSIYL